MAELPINLKIKNGLNPEKLESVECRFLLRAVPGNRQIYDARWNNKAVIVKIFSKKFFAHHHLKREWRGLNLLHKCRLNAPKPLFFGQTTDRRWAIVTGKIVDSSTALEVFNSAEDDQDRFKILVLVCKELAKQNNKGVLQKDLHLGNFLVLEDTVYALDPARMKFFHQPLCRSESISQLALLSYYLPDDGIELFDKLCKEYFDVRDWCFDETQKALVLKNRDQHRKEQIKKGLKKCMRTSKRVLKIRTSRHFALFDRSFIDSVNPIDFINQIDSLIDAGRILKKGNTSYVSRINFIGKDIVVKRYNHKGLVHSLRHTIMGSRARRCWFYGHLLSMLNIPTPKPIAFIEQRNGLLLWQSYLITEFVAGRRLLDFLEDKRTSELQRVRMIADINGILDKLTEYRLIHSDLKGSNILIAADGPALIDLDALKIRKWIWLRGKTENRLSKFPGKRLNPFKCEEG